MSNLLDGLGTELIILAITLAMGIGGYAVRKYRKLKQVQRSGDNSTLYQAGRDINKRD
jgi:uncharacterized protein HemX